MATLIGLIILSACGIGAVFWLLKNDTEAKEVPLKLSGLVEPPAEHISGNIQEKSTFAEQSKQKFSALSKLASKVKKKLEPAKISQQAKSLSSVLGNLLKKIKLGNKKSEISTAPEVTPMPDLRKMIRSGKKEKETRSTQEQVTAPSKEIQAGAEAMRIIPTQESAKENILSKEEEKEIEKEIELTTELKELQEKYAKLESLFDEKSIEFEKTKESLDHELENRKEFNKVKDLLEKELKESKDKARDIQSELNNSLTEGECHKKRSNQLEEKTTKLEKDLLKKEDKIDDLTKQMKASDSLSKAEASLQEDKKENAGAGQPENTNQTEAAPLPDEIKTQNIENSSQLEEPESKNSEEKEGDGDAAEAAPLQPKKPESENSGKSENAEDGRTEPKPQLEQPNQTGGFKLNLSVNQDADERPKDNEQSKDKEFLKLQPDVLSNESQENETEKPTSQSEEPQENPKSNQQENNDNSGKE